MSTTVVLGRTDGLSVALAAAFGTTVRSTTESVDADGVVIVVAAEPPPPGSSVSALSRDDWDRLTERPMRWALDALQWARTALLPHGGRVVVIVPTAGIAGAAHLVPYTTAIEGIRALTKSAARQWANDGIAVNSVAVPLALVAPDYGHLVSHLTPAALEDGTALVDSVVETTRFLLTDGVRHVVGATVVVDGGAVMAP